MIIFALKLQCIMYIYLSTHGYVSPVLYSNPSELLFPVIRYQVKHLIGKHVAVLLPAVDRANSDFTDEAFQFRPGHSRSHSDVPKHGFYSVDGDGLRIGCRIVDCCRFHDILLETPREFLRVVLHSVFLEAFVELGDRLRRCHGELSSSDASSCGRRCRQARSSG